MLGENIKTLRRKKGYSQETLAQEMFVVRQTVSKWERGLSVPDADMLEKLADVLDVSVYELLDKEIVNEEKEDNSSEVVKQLAILNEQLAMQTGRRKKIFKTIMTVIIVVSAVSVLLCIAVIPTYTVNKESGYSTTEEIVCIIGESEYRWEVTYDENGKVIEAHGDKWLEDNIDPRQYSDAEAQFKEIERYVDEHGGSYVYDE